MNDEGREAALGFGRGCEEDDTGDRCAQMNGDSPCNQGREAFWSRELQAEAPRHGGGLGVPEAEERTWNCVRGERLEPQLGKQAKMQVWRPRNWATTSHPLL